MATSTFAFNFNVDQNDPSTYRNRVLGAINISGLCWIPQFEIAGHLASTPPAVLITHRPGLAVVSNPALIAVAAGGDPNPPALAFKEPSTTPVMAWPEFVMDGGILANWGSTGTVVLGMKRELEANSVLMVVAEYMPVNPLPLIDFGRTVTITLEW